MKVDKINFFLDQNKAERFARSLKETGFAVITGSPIPGDLLHTAYSDWAKFFSSDSKDWYTFDPTTQSGYFPFKSENAKGSPAKDLKEFFHLYKASQLPLTMQYSPATMTLRSQLIQMAEILLSWLQATAPKEVTDSLSMPLPKMIENSPNTLFRILHYPPLPADAAPGEVRAAAHEDINLITLLPAATAPGLQVRGADGVWYEVPCDPNSVIVNAGDMLQLATGGYYKSTTHRVVNPEGSEALKSRYSMPLFLHPNSDVQLSSEMTAREYLDQRLRELGLKK
jgi:isopenicillin N synthase-like dioxygenase